MRKWVLQLLGRQRFEEAAQSVECLKVAWLARPEAEAALLQYFCLPGASVLEIGANFGQYAIRCAALVARGGAHGRVFVFEPAARTFRMLRRVDCEACGVKQERLDFVASNTKFTKRLALSIGGLCRTMPIKDVARRMNLDWHTVKELEKEYMREQLACAGPPSPSVIGVDEISIKKGHTYRIVVSDLEKRRAIWFGGNGRSEADMDQFYAFLGEETREKIRLAVMDMWKPFRKSTRAHAPRAAILFDKFHVLRHLGDALDKVRKAEYARVADAWCATAIFPSAS